MEQVAVPALGAVTVTVAVLSGGFVQFVPVAVPLSVTVYVPAVAGAVYVNAPGPEPDPPVIVPPVAVAVQFMLDPFTEKLREPPVERLAVVGTSAIEGVAEQVGGFTVTVVVFVAVFVASQVAFAVSVYVVVAVGLTIFEAPVTVSGVAGPPSYSSSVAPLLTDHASVLDPPDVMDAGDAVKEEMVGALHAVVVTVTVLLATFVGSHFAGAVSVYVVVVVGLTSKEVPPMTELPPGEIPTSASPPDFDQSIAQLSVVRSPAGTLMGLAVKEEMVGASQTVPPVHVTEAGFDRSSVLPNQSLPVA